MSTLTTDNPADIMRKDKRRRGTKTWAQTKVCLSSAMILRSLDDEQAREGFSGTSVRRSITYSDDRLSRKPRIANESEQNRQRRSDSSSKFLFFRGGACARGCREGQGERLRSWTSPEDPTHWTFKVPLTQKRGVFAIMVQYTKEASCAYIDISFV